MTISIIYVRILLSKIGKERRNMMARREVTDNREVSVDFWDEKIVFQKAQRDTYGRLEKNTL